VSRRIEFLHECQTNNKKEEIVLTTILIVVAVVLVGFLIIVAVQPSDFRVERSATIEAPATVLFPQVNDLHKFQDWSPWAKCDPACKTDFAGPPTGTGSSFHWAGNKKVGEGRMTITESRPNELVKFKLDFLKPFAAANTAEFAFKPDGGQTVVTWSMSGERNFFFKAFGLFVNCDKMIGTDFEKGLANMKAMAEAGVGHSAQLLV
jgi:hypothetical protein